MVQTRGFTIAEAAQLLRLTPQGVRNRGYRVVPGSRPQLLEWKQVAQDFLERIDTLGDELRAMKETGERLGIDDDAQGGSSDIPLQGLEVLIARLDIQQGELNALRAELAAERVGRVQAENRIDSLKEKLRQTNTIIEGLTSLIARSTPDPEFNLDAPIRG